MTSWINSTEKFLTLPTDLSQHPNRIENIVGKEESADNQHFLLFPQCLQKNLFLQVVTRQHCLINSFPNKPWFSCVCSTSLLKTLWEKEKLLVMSNFSFSHSVFYPFG